MAVKTGDSMKVVSGGQWAVLAMILSAAAWGMGIVMSKAVVTSVPPVTLLTIQLLASVAALWSATFALRIPFRRRDLRHGWTGMFEPGIAYLIGLLGVQFTTASNATLIAATEPFIILLLAVVFLREGITARTIVLLIASMIGVVLVSGAQPEQAAGSLTGDLLVFVGTAAAAVYVILSRKSVADVHPLPLAASQQSVGLLIALLALPVALLLGEASQLSKLTVSSVAFAAFSGVVQYSLAFALYLTALKSIPATQAALYLTLIPVFGVGGAMLFLGERLSSVQMLGAAIVVLALVAFQRRQGSP
ncbi:MAG: DMT family transporter [Chloroflexota bacterium]|nr:DMT family transporter [Chloroflexota bacterium]